MPGYDCLDRTVRTGLPGQDSKGGLPGQECQDMTAEWHWCLEPGPVLCGIEKKKREFALFLFVSALPLLIALPRPLLASRSRERQC
jgi:hypothetical protein